MEETPPPSSPSLAPVQLVYKKNASKDAKTAHLDPKTGVLRIEPIQQDDAAVESPIDSLIHLTTPMTTSVRSRAGNEFTLVLKFRLTADSATQKEAWLEQLSALGIQLSKDEEEVATTPKKERDAKAKRLVKRSRTSFGPGDTSAVLAARAGSQENLNLEKPVVKPGKEGVSSGEASPGTSPRIRAERSAPRGSSPRSSPTVSRRHHDSSLTSPKAKRSHRHSGNFTEDEHMRDRTSNTTTSSASPPPHGLMGGGGMSSSPLTATSALSLSTVHAASSTSGGSSPSSAHILSHDDFGDGRSSQLEPVAGSQTSTAGQQDEDANNLPLEPPTSTPRLVRVHGARNNIHASLVPRAASSLNKNDCFILDNGTGTIFTWKGKTANMFAKAECSDVANVISQATYAGKAQILVVEQTLEPQAFWDSLVSGRGDIADSDSTGVTSIVHFYKIPFDANVYESPDSTPSSALGRFVHVEEGKGQMRPSLLTTTPISALDTGFEIIICDDTKGLNEPIPEEILIDVGRRYKRDANRPPEVRITVSRGASSRQALLAHYLK